MWWLGAFQQQAITWANVDTDLSRHMVSLGVQWICHQWCCIQARRQTACHPCAPVVIGTSQPHSPEPLWPGLAIWGLDIFLAQGRYPYLCWGRWWYSALSGEGRTQIDFVLRWLVRFLKQVLPMTRSQDMTNSSNLSPSVFLVPQPCLPCTPSYPALDLSTWPFQSTKSIRISGVGISATTGWSLS